jgi:hypothetical protein
MNNNNKLQVAALQKTDFFNFVIGYTPFIAVFMSTNMKDIILVFDKTTWNKDSESFTSDERYSL